MRIFIPDYFYNCVSELYINFPEYTDCGMIDSASKIFTIWWLLRSDYTDNNDEKVILTIN